MEKTIQRLTNAIKRGKFAEDKYFCGGIWHGIKIRVQGFYCSCRRAGYHVFIDDANGVLIATIQHKYDLNKTEVEYYNF